MQRHAPSRARLRPASLACVLVALLAGCVTQPRDEAPARHPADVRAQLVQLLPRETRDREGWATDIQSAFQLLDVPPSTENLCAALAVTEQESTFTADPVVPGLARIARAELDRRAAERRIPQLLVRAALLIKSPDGRSYGQRIAAVRTEKEMSGIFEDLIAKVPMGQRLLGGANPVRTGGPMQVSIAFAQQHARNHPYPYATTGSIRDEVFTRRGGMYFGIAHLLDYPSSYTRHLYRYADFNADWYASRNAAFQAAVTAASGVPLALDGDLVLHGNVGDRIGATESAVRSLGGQIGMSDAAIRRALDQGDRYEFERTDLHERVFALAERMERRPLPRAVMPDIDLHSPKFTRKLTTQWFATRVEQRYRRCVAQAFAGKT
ncbi:MAG TPA: DUF1615 domain-containing protein [Lysobacter sp.]|nr:DUF1615 domain-containing protein [Lysobacter sp.]